MIKLEQIQLLPLVNISAKAEVLIKHKLRRKGNPSALLVGMQTGAATAKNNMEFLQKTKNRTAL